MQRIQPGLIGWASKRRGVRSAGMVRWVGAVVIVAALAACSSSKPASQGTGPEGGGAAGMGDQNLGAAGSMAKFQHGTLGAGGSGGPLTDVHFEYDD